MRAGRPQLASDHGFTIVEMAIVMVIVGILVVLGVSMIGPLARTAKVNETRGIVDAGVESLIGYAATNRRLPRATLPPPPAEYKTVFSKPNDAWGNPIEYIVDASLTGTADSICGRRPSAITVRQCTAVDGAGNCTASRPDIPNVAFVVGSSGPNFNNQTAVTQAVPGTAPLTVTVYDAGLSVDAYAGDIGGVRREPYDDVVKWVTLDELRIKSGCARQGLRIVNNELPAGNVTNLYSAFVYGDGGVPYGSGGSYGWCLQTATGVLATDLPGFTATPGTASTNCQGLAEASWGRANNIQITKPAGASSLGSYNVTVYVRDNADTAGGNDNIAYRAFVITISP